MDANALEAAHEQSLKFYWLASIVILFYDYFVTFDSEVHHLWGRPGRPTFTQCLFYVNRYFPLIAYAVILWFIFDRNASAETCQSFKQFPPLAMFISDAVMGAILILRTNALYSNSRHVLAVLIIVYMTQVVFGGVVAGAATRCVKWRGHLGCITPYPESFNDILWFLWPTACIFDFLVLYLTLHRTLKMRKASSHLHIVDMIHRDGIVYFAVMFVAKLVNLIIFFAASRDLVNINWVFNNTICVIMVNRLTLNMRKEVARKVTGEREYYPQEHRAALDEKGSHLPAGPSRRLSDIPRSVAIASSDGTLAPDGAWTQFSRVGEFETYNDPFHFERSEAHV